MTPQYAPARKSSDSLDEEALIVAMCKALDALPSHMLLSVSMRLQAYFTARLIAGPAFLIKPPQDAEALRRQKIRREFVLCQA